MTPWLHQHSFVLHTMEEILCVCVCEVVVKPCRTLVIHGTLCCLSCMTCEVVAASVASPYPGCPPFNSSSLTSVSMTCAYQSVCVMHLSTYLPTLDCLPTYPSIHLLSTVFLLLAGHTASKRIVEHLYSRHRTQNIAGSSFERVQGAKAVACRERRELMQNRAASWALSGGFWRDSLCMWRAIVDYVDSTVGRLVFSRVVLECHSCSLPLCLNAFLGCEGLPYSSVSMSGVCAGSALPDVAMQGSSQEISSMHEAAAEEEMLEVRSCWPQLISRPLWVPAPTVVSFLEEGFLEHCHWAQQPQHYWLAEFSFGVPGVDSVDHPGALEWQAILRELLQRHLACRTYFKERACSSGFQASYKMEPMFCLASSEQGFPESEMREPVGPLGDPPVRISIRVLASKLIVGLVAHPVLLDTWSIEALLHELCSLLKQSLDKSVRLPTVNLDRADFAEWQRRAASSGLWSSAIMRRVDRLRGFVLPRDEPRLCTSAMSGYAAEHVRIDPDAMKSLAGTATSWHVTPLEVVLAMFMLQLRSWRQRLVFGVPHSCRLSLEIVGCCTNMLLVCLGMPVEIALFQAVQEVHAELQSARRDGAAPMKEIAGLLQREGVDRGGSREVLYDVFYDWRHRPHLEGTQAFGLDAAVQTACGPKFKSSFADLELHLLSGDAADITFVYHPELIGDGVAKHLIRRLNASMRCGSDVEAVERGMSTDTCFPDSPAVDEAKTLDGLPAGSNTLAEMRAAVAAALPQEDAVSDDLPLESLGLDSVSTAFLQGRLSELFGLVLPVWLLPQATTAQLSLAAGLRPKEGPAHKTRTTKTSSGPGGPIGPSDPSDPSGSSSCRQKFQRFHARLAVDADCQALARLWNAHHHLLEMVPQTTWVLLTGPPAWVATSALLLGLVRSDWSLASLQHDIGLRAAAGYAFLVMLQHFLHWLLARCILAYDVHVGELSPRGWEKSTLHPAAVLVVERPRLCHATAGADQSGVLGVACVRVSISRNNPKTSGVGCCRKRGRAVRVASLWHAAVIPSARNQGAAKTLIDFAETWAMEVGAARLEAVCLNPAAKAACWNMGLDLWNPRIACWPLAPAFFYKDLADDKRAHFPKETKRVGKALSRACRCSILWCCMLWRCWAC